MFLPEGMEYPAFWQDTSRVHADILNPATSHSYAVMRKFAVPWNPGMFLYLFTIYPACCKSRAARLHPWNHTGEYGSAYLANTRDVK